MLSTLFVSVLAFQLKSQEAPSAVKPIAPMTRPSPDKVVAIVDGQSITARQVEGLLWDWKYKEILDTLIEFQIVGIEAKKRHLTVTPEEIQAQVDSILQRVRQQNPTEPNPWKLLAAQGVPESRLRASIKTGLLLRKIAEMDFKPNDFVDVSQILVKAKSGSAEDQAAAMKTAQDYYAQLQKGTPWSQVLALSTTDAQDIKSDGKLGLRALSMFTPQSAAELATLKPGQVTHPTNTPLGYQIYKLNGFGSKAAPGEIDRLKQEFVQRHQQEVMLKLRTAAKIVTID